MPATRSIPWDTLPHRVRTFLVTEGVEPGSLVRFKKRVAVSDAHLIFKYRLRRDLNHATRRGAMRMMAGEFGLHVDTVRKRLRGLRREFGVDVVD
jgi:hypothetical protein